VQPIPRVYTIVTGVPDRLSRVLPSVCGDHE
jgi:hypothetical protein